MTNEKIAKLFEYKRMSDFEKNLKDLVRIHAEKFMIVSTSKSTRLMTTTKSNLLKSILISKLSEGVFQWQTRAQQT